MLLVALPTIAHEIGESAGSQRLEGNLALTFFGVVLVVVMLAAPGGLRIEASTLRYLDSAGLPELFRFPRDIGRVAAPINRLNDQKLVAIYTREWSVWTR